MESLCVPPSPAGARPCWLYSIMELSVLDTFLPSPCWSPAPSRGQAAQATPSRAHNIYIRHMRICALLHDVMTNPCIWSTSSFVYSGTRSFNPSAHATDIGNINLVLWFGLWISEIPPKIVMRNIFSILSPVCYELYCQYLHNIFRLF